jgi:hypothetical protein
MKDERKYTVSNNSQNKILFSQVVLAPLQNARQQVLRTK